jgi:hypothetical protein
MRGEGAFGWREYASGWVVGQFGIGGRPILAAAAFLGGQSRLKAVPRGPQGALQTQTDPLPHATT